MRFYNLREEGTELHVSGHEILVIRWLRHAKKDDVSCPTGLQQDSSYGPTIFLIQVSISLFLKYEKWTI